MNEPPGPVEAREYLASQPPELRVNNALERIRRKIGESGRRLAVLDDDPTGTQTVHGVPVLTTWSVEDLRWALEQPSSTFYILTNSRSFPEEEAARMNREISANLASAAEQAGAKFAIVSRGDSTLRGHFPAETEALEEALRVGFDGIVLWYARARALYQRERRSSPATPASATLPRTSPRGSKRRRQAACGPLRSRAWGSRISGRAGQGGSPRCYST